MLKTAGYAVVDMVYMLEGQRQDELPERILACVRWNYFEPEELYVYLDASGQVIKQKS